MPLLQIDLNKCTRCGICAESCPIGIIGKKEGFPELYSGTEKACIACGHCVAVCPTAALDNEKNPLENQLEIKKFPVIDSESASKFLRSRRSIRNYKKDRIPRENLLKLLDIARFAPTGGNTQNISYVVIEGEERLKKITEMVIEWMEKEIENKAAWIRPYAAVPSIYRRTGTDIILRNAPHVILALAPADFALGRDNSLFSFAYTELYANTIGIGTCWAGFLEMCLRANYEPLIQLLNLPGNKQVTAALMAGYPKYQYSRMPDRNPLKVDWI